MNSKKIFYLILFIAVIVGVIASVIMLITAMRFGEVGRVFLYAVTTLICTETGIILGNKLFSGNNNNA